MKNIERKLQSEMKRDGLLSLIAASACEHGVDLYLVGGFIRDTILKTRTNDVDFIVIGRKSGFYKALEERTGHRVITFRKKGIVNRRIIVDRRTFDFVDATKKGLLQELSRRDFTINSIAFSVCDKILIDTQGGMIDLKKKIIRRNKRSVFRSDPLRMIRAVRLACEKDGFTIDEETYHQIKSSPEIISRVSGERIKEELDRIMESSRASKGFHLLCESGLLRTVVPELMPLKDVPQGERHYLDAWKHTLKTLSYTDDLRSLCSRLKLRYPKERDAILLLKYAALFHDIAKPQTFSKDEKGNIHFFHHEKLSAVVASRIMKRLKFPIKFSGDVKRIIELHLRPHLLAEASPSDKALMRLIAESRELTELLALLSLADALATAKLPAAFTVTRLRKLLGRVIKIYRSKGTAIAQPEKLISGDDVMKILGLTEGPDVGKILRKIHDLQITGDIATRQQALLFLSSLSK